MLIASIVAGFLMIAMMHWNAQKVDAIHWASYIFLSIWTICAFGLIVFPVYIRYFVK